MVPGWLNALAWGTLALGAACALVILADILVGDGPRMGVMKAVWPITGLYMGPLAIWAYFRFGRAKRRPAAQAHAGGGGGGHKPFWATVFVAATHCGAGCTIGDTLGEWAVFGLGLTLWGSAFGANLAVAFALAYLVGIAFQYFAIVPMRHLAPREGVWAAIKADTLSLVAYEVGMFAVMAAARALPWRTDPSMPAHWLIMQVAMLVGFATTYPMNWFLVRHGLKEAM